MNVHLRFGRERLAQGGVLSLDMFALAVSKPNFVIRTMTPTWFPKGVYSATVVLLDAPITRNYEHSGEVSWDQSRAVEHQKYHMEFFCLFVTVTKLK